MKSKNQPLLSGKRGLYTIHPMKETEVIELEQRDLPTNNPPSAPPQPAQPQSMKTFATAIAESESLSFIFITLGSVCSGPSEDGSYSSGRV